jgi:hypothetical protein
VIDGHSGGFEMGNDRVAVSPLCNAFDFRKDREPTGRAEPPLLSSPGPIRRRTASARRLGDVARHRGRQIFLRTEATARAPVQRFGEKK